MAWLSGHSRETLHTPQPWIVLSYETNDNNVDAEVWVNRGASQRGVGRQCAASEVEALPFMEILKAGRASPLGPWKTHFALHRSG